MLLSDRLLAAQDYLISHGWCQGRSMNMNGEVCVAMALTQGTISDGFTSLALFRDAVGIHGIIQWNDAPERTPEQVLAAFDKAVAFARAQEGERQEEKDEETKTLARAGSTE